MDNGIANIPRMTLCLPPATGWHQAAACTGQFNIQIHTKAEAIGHGGNLIHAGATRHFVEIDIAALRYAVAHIHPAMAASLVAMEAVIAEIEMSGAMHSIGGTADLGFQRCQRHHHLESGSGRIEPIGRLVDQGCGA